MATLRSFGGRSFTTRSPMMMRPSEISSRPATMRMAVDLPQPDGPTTTRNSSLSISMLNLSTEGVSLPGYTLVTLSKMIRAIGMLLHRLQKSGNPVHPVPASEAPYDPARPFACSNRAIGVSILQHITALYDLLSLLYTFWRTVSMIQWISFHDVNRNYDISLFGIGPWTGVFAHLDLPATLRSHFHCIP